MSRALHSLAVLACSLLAVCCQAQKKPEAAVSESFFEVMPGDPLPLNVTPSAIRDASNPGSPPPRATPSGNPAWFVRSCAGDELNSRLAAPLPPGDWTVSRKSPITLAYNPRALLLAPDRLLAVSDESWELFDRGGLSLASAVIRAGALAIDASRSEFLGTNLDGFVTAWKLADGSESFGLSTLFAQRVRRDLITRVGERILLASVETFRPPHSDVRPNLSLIELYDPGNPPQRDSSKLLVSAKLAANLMRRTTSMLVARRAENLVVCDKDWIYHLTPDLSIRSALQAEFTPLRLSLDEAGRAYLVVSTTQGAELWVVPHDGQRTVRASIPLELREPLVPPIVAHDHRIFIAAGDRVAAFHPDGKPAWERALSRVAGAVISADDQLLVSAGAELLAFDSDGRARVLCAFDGDLLRTPAVIDDTGAIFVASAGRLYQLSVRP